MEQLLLIVQVVLALGIIGLVLIQRTDQDGLSGLGGGGGGFGVISGRAKSNLFTRMTAIFAALFMLNSLVLSILVARSNAVSLLDRVATEAPLNPGEKAISVPVLDKDNPPATEPVEKPASPDKKEFEPGNTVPVDAPRPQGIEDVPVDDVPLDKEAVTPEETEVPAKVVPEVESKPKTTTVPKAE